MKVLRKEYVDALQENFDVTMGASGCLCVTYYYTNDREKSLVRFGFDLLETLRGATRKGDEYARELLDNLEIGARRGNTITFYFPDWKWQ